MRDSRLLLPGSHMDHLHMASEQTGGIMEPCFIDLEEITDVIEEPKERSKEEEQDNSEKEELRKKLSAIRTKCRQERELHDHMFERGQELEQLINKAAAENRYLTGRVKRLQQQMENTRTTRKEKDEETLLKLQPKVGSTAKNHLMYIWEKENEIQKLRAKNEDLIAEIEKLCVEGKPSNLETAEPECEDLQRKEDEEEEEWIIAAESIEKSETSEQYYSEESSAGDSDDDDGDDDDDDDKTERWLPWANVLRGLKVGGYISLCVLLLLSVSKSKWLQSVCDQYDTADALLPYCSASHTNPSSH